MSFVDRFFRKRTRSFDAHHLPNGGKAPELPGIAGWINAEPLSMDSLRGRPVLVSFWTHSCINCIRAVPMLQSWHDRYKNAGLTIIGVHSPECSFEKDEANVQEAVRRLGITYPVALDPEFATWNAYRNRYWPAHYLADASGNIRHRHVGEGGYGATEEAIRAMLAEAGGALPEPAGHGEPPDISRTGTPEAYLGFERSEYLGSPEAVRKDEVRRYGVPRELSPDKYYLDGAWRIRDGFAEPAEAGAAIVYKVTASSVHVVADAASGGGRVTVTLDGGPVPPPWRGADIIEDAGATALRLGSGRLYDVVDFREESRTAVMRLEFRDPGTRCFAITFS